MKRIYLTKFLRMISLKAKELHMIDLNFTDVSIIGGISAISGSIRSYFEGSKRTLQQHLVMILISVFVGEMAGFMALAFTDNKGIMFGVVSIAALLSESIIRSLMKVGSDVEKDPIGTIKKIKRVRR